jgi:hypothetical protein
MRRARWTPRVRVLADRADVVRPRRRVRRKLLVILELIFGVRWHEGPVRPVRPTGRRKVRPVRPTGGRKVRPVRPTVGRKVRPVRPTGGMKVRPVRPKGKSHGSIFFCFPYVQ